MPEVPEAFKNFSNYLTILSSYYSRNQEMPKAFKNLILNKLVVTREAFLHAKTVEVKKEIIHAWNSFIINVANPRPPNVGLAIVAITEKPLEPTVELSNKLENVPLAEGRLDQTKASTVLKAIIGTYPDAIQNNILVATKGALGHVLIENPFENKI